MNKDEKALLIALEVGDFPRANGRILRTLNVLSGRWIRLSAMREALHDIEDIDRSLIYLERGEYIKARNIETRKTIEIEYANNHECEVALTTKGMDILCYAIENPSIEV
jgi:hypothetical protein